MGKLPSCLTPDCLAKVQQLNDEHAVKAAVDANMHVGGTTVDAVQAAVAKVHEFIDRGAGDRKRAADIKKWRDAMRKYEGEISSLPAELQNAEKHYLSLAGWTWPGRPDQKFTGDSAYRNKKYYDYLQAARKQKEVSLVEGDAAVQRLDVLLDGYRTGLIYASKMHDLYEIRARENAELREALRVARSRALTNDRRVFYEDIERESLVSWRRLIYVVVYCSFVVYFCLGDGGVTIKTMRSDGFHRTKVFWTSMGLSLVYLSMPLWLDAVIQAGFRAWWWLRYARANKAPRDVYSSL